MFRLLICLLAFIIAPSAHAEVLVNSALDGAIAVFEKAALRLGRETFDVDVPAYHEALTQRRFVSGYWGQTLTVSIASAKATDPGCNSFAAYVTLPPRDGVVTLVTCPQFLSPGADALRRLTILHEMVHVVAGPDECRAMAFAARLEQLALGQHTPVERYWRANNCAASSFSLP